MLIPFLPISKRTCGLPFQENSCAWHKQQRKLVYSRALQEITSKKRENTHTISQHWLCFINFEYKLNIQRKKTQTILIVLIFSYISYPWRVGCGSISSLSQSLKAPGEDFFCQLIGLVLLCLFPLEKSEQWLIEEEISLEFGWGIRKVT